MIETFTGAVIGLFLMGVISGPMGFKPAPQNFQPVAEMAGGDGH